MRSSGKTDVKPPRERGPEEKSPTSTPSPGAFTLRAVLVGLGIAVPLNLWVHYAELVLGGSRGHTALVNTSIPFGPFAALFALVVLNLIVTRFLPGLSFSRGELLTIYVMSITATVMSSSGGMHMLIPTITAAHYFASQSNGWMDLFAKHIPSWIAQKNPAALKAFYEGNAVVDLRLWVTQIAVWMGFLITFAGTTLCIVVLFRKQWIEVERLPFPTVALPLDLTKEGTPLLKNKLFWIGTLLAFGIGALNNLHYNIPAFPGLDVRKTDLELFMTSPPWNAMGYTPVSFFPFAIGIGFLLSTEVAFSCWFFYLLTKVELVLGAMFQSEAGIASGAQSAFPYIGYQGSGAFLAVAVSALWLGRRHLRSALGMAFGGRRRKSFATGVSDLGDAVAYRWAFLGLAAGFAALVAFSVEAGARTWLAAANMTVLLMYLVGMTRIRAETGNAWPVGPDLDSLRLLQAVMGTKAFAASDLTALSYVRAGGGADFRGAAMPHQLDALKMADQAKIDYRRLVGAMLLAVAIGGTISFITALAVWTSHGALAKVDSWRGLSGQRAFTEVEQALKSATSPDWSGMKGVGAGAAITLLLAFLRSKYIWWPFHPVGYAMANTWTMSYTWCPFFIAWLAKTVLIRFGGLKLYRTALPVFLGLIVGDILHGAFFTLLACFAGTNVYPANW